MTSSEPSETPQKRCLVCGGTPNGSRYGALACLGCIVFFRRAISNANVKNCDNNSNCKIGFETKNCCRSCRLQKCLQVGMNPKAIQHRDLIGPRKPVKVEPETQKSKLHHLLELQRKQWSRNQKHQAQTGSFKKQADSDDVRFVMSLGFQNALSWANHFETFTKLSEDQKALVMSEFGIAFILIEQAFKTAEDTEEGCWILQNDTFLEISDTRNVQGQKRINSEFADFLFKTLSEPIRSLQLDKFECVVLKTMVLLSQSFPSQLYLPRFEENRKNCMKTLMKYELRKFPETGSQRFGEIILLLSSVRCAVKQLYNHTKRSDLFNVNNYDAFTRKYIVT
ncbi:Nuclear Hormone Receptor family [Caenorhabditis elegans]|uniref:Nuclear Hormone Receptor family n=1 Tax=Caenorhabditis elegans TaxID=6239 RepID=O45987_CAEEL|nr:Nuclear Hormone Receptor family [Caenorhabditis elegans]CAB03504.1 Nuclear Hormone Receptor family [Caenorhabditis elegans]|eukprot:NP_506798.1 Nuclear Hormone Receptor family [Caenorhabditis elegans]